MSDKDLGESIENFEEEVENLKHKEFKLFGFKVTPTTLMAAFALISSAIGGLYGAFTVYNDYMDMKAQIQEYVAPDLSGIQEQLSVMDEKMNAVVIEVNVIRDASIETEARVRDIKGDLREDINRIETIVDQVEDDIRETETDVRDMIQNAEERFENKRDALQNDYDQARERLNTNIEREMEELEDRLNTRLQRALDNPLAN